ncbi:cysteinyl-trna synthetase [Holotrichia oblita]|nr:cysteinyl-trna synthetase [Holotrichia oblita]
MLKIYNSLTRKIEELIPQNAGEIKMYTCGPTVYYYPHIGNMRAYIFMDSLRRILKYNGYKVTGVMNITDVGHLISDSDEGDDKMELAAKKENKHPLEIAKFYTGIFLNDLKMLNIDIPEHITKATEYIPQMIDFIKILEQKGYTYRLDDGIYFDIKKFKSYGQLSHKDLDKTGVARVEENENKRHAFDFALWKFVPKEHIMKWESPWGIGCPGWHIECSAMSKDCLGSSFDIHTGGIDHLPIHHENEIAQNDAAAGKQVVKYWMHNEFVQVDGGKMSKSLNNIYTVSQLKEKGFDPIDFKYFCLNTNYSKTINFTFEALKAAQSARKSLKQLLFEHKSGNNATSQSEIQKNKEDFVNALNDNLNTPLALGIIWTIVKNRPKSRDIYNLIIDFDKSLGLRLDEEEAEQLTEIPKNIQELAELRLKARQNKNWAESDRLRGELNKMGWAVKDNKDGYELTKV